MAGRTGETAVTKFTDGCPGLQSMLAEASITTPPIADWFHIAMRLQHAKQAAGGLSTDEPRRTRAKTAIFRDTPARQPPLAPVRLVLVDEADRLRVSSLEQLRDLFDRNPTGLVLLGMPGMEKRLARYPQLYSRVGFVHAFRPLRANEIRQLLAAHCHEMGLDLPADGVSDPDCVAAIIRITAGNFRLIHRLLSQVERILRVNGLSAVTPAVIDAAREGLVIGAA